MTSPLLSAAPSAPLASPAPRRRGRPPKVYGAYSVIYADPPWSYRVWNKPTAHGRTAASHYQTLRIADLMHLPIGKLAAKDCALFLWATMPLLQEAFALIDAWGFTYKTCAFSWTKTTKDGRKPAVGMGYWTRANTELCLLATRGHAKRKAANVPQVLLSPRRTHSEKPIEIYDRIERLVEGPYLELFARQAHDGWTSLGNAIDGKDIRETLAAYPAPAS